MLFRLKSCLSIGVSPTFTRPSLIAATVVLGLMGDEKLHPCNLQKQCRKLKDYKAVQ